MLPIVNTPGITLWSNPCPRQHARKRPIARWVGPASSSSNRAALRPCRRWPTPRRTPQPPPPASSDRPGPAWCRASGPLVGRRIRPTRPARVDGSGAEKRHLHPMPGYFFLSFSRSSAMGASQMRYSFDRKPSWTRKSETFTSGLPSPASAASTFSANSR
jgi:hypothetical protein